MRLYKLLKDTPTIKAGTMFREVVSDYDGARELARITPIGAKTSPQFTIQDIDNFDEWFEEIKGPVDGIHWKPKYDDWYFYISDHGSVCSDIWNDNYTDNNRLAFGSVYRTEKEAQKACERRLAKVRLQQTSDFKPDFENGKGGWFVFYSYMYKELHSMRDSYTDSGELVRYETEEDARRSIEENEQDWKIYFGIKEEE
nr:MAG TPA: hypothetical protein [Caudoviricetes sp.]